MADTRRLDAELVTRDLARSRGVARELIRTGAVTVDGRPANKPATPVDPDTVIEVSDTGARWVSRGAVKLQAALTEFAAQGLSVAGRSALDAGASTGGFTQVLLEHGASSVLAVDVGHGQLAEPVASDPRVTEHSGRSVRGLRPDLVGGPVELLVADLSFISLTLVLADLATLVVPGGDLILLVKPQFEVGRGGLGKNGVVTSAGDREAALARVLAAAQECRLRVRATIPSPIVGSHGNHEYLTWLTNDVGGPWHAQGTTEQTDPAPTPAAKEDR